MSRRKWRGPTMVSLDLDDLGCYRALYGRFADDQVDDDNKHHTRHYALTRWLPRFLELFERHRVQATLFVVGRDLEASPLGAQVLAQALRSGHELASHSYMHAYNMSTWDMARIRADLARCDACLRAVGAQPLGFRAPGYVRSKALSRVVASLGYTYESSAMPSPPYLLAKWTIMAWLRMRGQPSCATLAGAGGFFASREVTHEPDVGLRHIPMGVTPWLRVPMIGTSMLHAPSPLRAWLRRVASTLPEFHLELHAIDLADPVSDGIATRLPELRVPYALRRKRLDELLAACGPTITLAERASR